MYSWDQDTAINEIHQSDSSPKKRTFSANVTRNWNVRIHPNGGYLTGILLKATEAVLPHPHPIVMSITFVSPVEVGPVTVQVETIKVSKRSSHAMAIMFQNGEEIARMTTTFANLTDVKPTILLGKMPEILPLSECVERPHSINFPIFDSVYNYVDPTTPKGTYNAWISFRDGREVDVLSLPSFADFMPPAVLTLYDAYWVPTIQYTVQVRQLPAKGMLKAFSKTRFVIGPYLETDTEIYDSEDKLVVLARQTAMSIPFKKPKPKL